VPRNWEKHFGSPSTATLRARCTRDLDVDDFCAMCGHDWCSVRISKGIRNFPVAKRTAIERVQERALGRAARGAQRGVLSPPGSMARDQDAHRGRSRSRKRWVPQRSRRRRCAQIQQQLVELSESRRRRRLVNEAIEVSKPFCWRATWSWCARCCRPLRSCSVPFLDDILQRIRQYLVSRLLRQGGRSGSSRVGPLWRDEGVAPVGA
jgi:hypothetical protein